MVRRVRDSILLWRKPIDSGSFFKRGTGFLIPVGMISMRHDFPPPVAMQQVVSIILGNLMPDFRLYGAFYRVSRDDDSPSCFFLQGLEQLQFRRFRKDEMTTTASTDKGIMIRTFCIIKPSPLYHCFIGYGTNTCNFPHADRGRFKPQVNRLPTAKLIDAARFLHTEGNFIKSQIRSNHRQPPVWVADNIALLSINVYI